MAGSLRVVVPSAQRDQKSQERREASAEEAQAWIRGQFEQAVQECSNSINQALEARLAETSLSEADPAHAEVQVDVDWEKLPAAATSLVRRILTAGLGSKASIRFASSNGSSPVQVGVSLPPNKEVIPLLEREIQIQFPLPPLSSPQLDLLRRDFSMVLVRTLNHWVAEHQDKLPLHNGRPRYPVFAAISDPGLRWTSVRWHSQEMKWGFRVSDDVSCQLDPAGRGVQFLIPSVNAVLDREALPGLPEEKKQPALLAVKPFLVEILAHLKFDESQKDRARHLLDQVLTGIFGKGPLSMGPKQLFKFRTGWGQLAESISCLVSSELQGHQPPLPTEIESRFSIDSSKARDALKSEKLRTKAGADLEHSNAVRKVISALSEDPAIEPAQRTGLLTSLRGPLQLIQARQFKEAATRLSKIAEQFPTQYRSELEQIAAHLPEL